MKSAARVAYLFHQDPVEMLKKPPDELHMAIVMAQIIDEDLKAAQASAPK